jgi:hypothetical protein
MIQTTPHAAGSSMTVRDTTLANEVSVSGDMAPTAAAAAAKAEIEASYVVALRNPRDIDGFRQRILRDCRRPGFADTALYHRPVGRERDPATGEWRDAFAINFSIRFIEAALMAWKNVHTTSRITYEDQDRGLLTVKVLDLESNVAYSTDATIDKLIERKEVKKGRVARGVRENSYGDMVYLLDATKDEFRNLMGAERSKLIRDNGQRLLPRDILEEARVVIDSTVQNESAKDPDSAKKKIMDKFSSLGITPAMLKEYLDGQPVEGLTLEGLQQLGLLYNGLKEGQYTWPEVMRVKAEAAEAEGDQKLEPAKRERVRDRILNKKTEPPPAGTEEQK